MVKEDVHGFLSHLEEINKKQLVTLKDFQTKVHSLLENKHLVTMELLPILKKATSSSKYLSQLNNTALKIQTNLSININGLLKDAELKNDLLQREIITMSFLNKSMQENYKSLRIASVHPGLQGTEAFKKIEDISDNLYSIISNSDRTEMLNAHSKKLINKLNLLLNKKSEIINTKIKIINYCSKANLENLDQNLKNLIKIQNYIISLANKLEETIKEVESDFLESYSNILQDKMLINKNISEKLNKRSFTNKNLSLLSKKVVLSDLKKFSKEEELNNYVSGLKTLSNNTFLDIEVKNFLNSL